MISPLKSTKCPFVPTCSNYAVEAIGKYGSLKGIVLGAWRILRCNPFNKGYYDPPEFWADKMKLKKKNK